MNAEETLVAVKERADEITKLQSQMVSALGNTSVLGNIELEAWKIKRLVWCCLNEKETDIR